MNHKNVGKVPMTVEIDPRTVEIEPRTVEIEPRTVEIELMTIDIEPRTVETEPRTVEMKLGEKCATRHFPTDVNFFTCIYSTLSSFATCILHICV